MIYTSELTLTVGNTWIEFRLKPNPEMPHVLLADVFRSTADGPRAIDGDFVVIEFVPPRNRNLWADRKRRFNAEIRDFVEAIAERIDNSYTEAERRAAVRKVVNQFKRIAADING